MVVVNGNIGDTGGAYSAEFSKARYQIMSTGTNEEGVANR